MYHGLLVVEPDLSKYSFPIKGLAEDPLTGAGFMLPTTVNAAGETIFCPFWADLPDAVNPRCPEERGEARDAYQAQPQEIRQILAERGSDLGEDYYFGVLQNPSVLGDETLLWEILTNGGGANFLFALASSNIPVPDCLADITAKIVSSRDPANQLP